MTRKVLILRITNQPTNLRLLNAIKFYESILNKENFVRTELTPNAQLSLLTN